VLFAQHGDRDENSIGLRDYRGAALGLHQQQQSPAAGENHRGSTAQFDHDRRVSGRKRPALLSSGPGRRRARSMLCAFEPSRLRPELAGENNTRGVHVKPRRAQGLGSPGVAGMDG
jgi:hypothetical protein